MEYTLKDVKTCIDYAKIYYPDIDSPEFTESEDPAIPNSGQLDSSQASIGRETDAEGNSCFSLVRVRLGAYERDTGMREPSESPPIYFTSPYTLAKQMALSVYTEGLNDLFEEGFLCGEEVEKENITW